MGAVMIKVSAFYPAGANTKFDWDYYCNRHMKMVREKLGAACKRMVVEQGIGCELGEPAIYVAMGHLYFDSIAEADAAIRPHAEEIIADMRNYTNVRPLIQVSEVKDLSGSRLARLLSPA